MQPPSRRATDQPLSSADATVEEKIRLLMKLRNSGINDRLVLGAIESTPRELFIAEAFRDQAYRDVALPIEMGQTISQPSVVAWMSYALDTNDRHRVLEIGTGSGYQAAVLSKLCRMVYTIERHRGLHDVALERFRQMDLKNITSLCGDGSRGWPEAAPYDRIIVTAAAGEVPHELLEQLNDGGVMVVPVGNEGHQQLLLRITREGDNFATQHLMPVSFVPLVQDAE